MPARVLARSFQYYLLPALRSLHLLAVLVLATTTLVAQTSYVAPRDFQSTIQRAAVIFDGTVTAVHCGFGVGKLPQTYRISFRVQQGIRGTTSGSTYTIPEWAGLWRTRQKPRYRVGERALLFLYSPSNAGLTSTVGGGSGKLVIVSNARHEPQVLLPTEWLGSVVQPLSPSGNTSANPSMRVPSPPTLQVPEGWLLQRITQMQVSHAGGK